MKLYLMRHGEAVDPTVKLSCPLSESGKVAIKTMADFLAQNPKASAQKIYHSQKLRAAQTATLIAPALLAEGEPEELPGLNPTASISSMVDQIQTWQENVCLVSHLPFLPRLASALLTGGDQEKAILAFEPGGLVCLECLDSASALWELKWFLCPSLFQVT